MTPEIAERIKALTGRKPTNEDEAIFLIHDRLEIFGEDAYHEIDDLDVLLDIVNIYETGTIPLRKDPFLRTGRCIPIDEWGGIDDLKRVESLAKENGWIVKKLKHYWSFHINGRTYFTIAHTLRKTKCNNYSCRMVVREIIDMSYLYSFLDNFNLNEFKNKKWKARKNYQKKNRVEIVGQFFFLQEIERFLIEIPKRL